MSSSVVNGLAARRVTVDVPASTANLGAGFDVLALALDLRNVITVEVAHGAPPGSVELVVKGEGAGRLRPDRRNRFVVSLERGLLELGIATDQLAWRVHMRNGIPLSRGLGSSASVTVAGLLAADALRGGGALSQDRVLVLAVEAEGHPDNAAAALLGGFVVAANIGGVPHAVRLDPPEQLLAVLYVPNRPLATSAMRAALPASVPFRDAVHNVGAASLAVAAIASGRLDLLRAATEDRLHEPYRARAYPELPRLTAAARAAGAFGACLSGAGSTVIAFADDADLAARVAAALRTAAHAANLRGTVQVVRPRAQGALVQVE